MKLRVTIKKLYFEQIKAGIKKEEYRLITPYWKRRLIGKNYESIVFINGYFRDAPRLELEYLGYEIKQIIHAFFGNEPVDVFAIKLGNVLEQSATESRNNAQIKLF